MGGSALQEETARDGLQIIAIRSTYPRNAASGGHTRENRGNEQIESVDGEGVSKAGS